MQVGQFNVNKEMRAASALSLRVSDGFLFDSTFFEGLDAHALSRGRWLPD